MAWLEMGNLGDHLRVGPQFVPKASRAAMVIQRGPHGQRLAPADPSRGGPVGELRWWKESLYQPGDWLPRQKVVGVMGMGALGETSFRTRRNLTKWSHTYLQQAKTAPLDQLPSVISLSRARMSGIAGQYWTVGSGEDEDGNELFWDSSEGIKNRFDKAIKEAEYRLGQRTERAPETQVQMDPRTSILDYPGTIASETARQVTMAVGGVPATWALATPAEKRRIKKALQDAGLPVPDDLRDLGDDLMDLLEKALIAAGVVVGGAIIIKALI